MAASVASLPDRLRHLSRRDGVRIAAGLTPALLAVAVLFGGAAVLAVTRSLGASPFAPGAAVSLDAYRDLAADREFLRSIALTAYIAVAATTASVVLGVAAALVLRRVARGGRTFVWLFQLNLPIPHVIGAIAMLSLLGQSGLLSRIATRSGLIDGPAAFPALVYDPAAIGIIAQYVWKEVPFIGIVALAMLRAVGDDLDEAARTLGASGRQRLRHVTLPLVLPGVLSAAIIVFAFTFGAFEVPLLLGRSYPAMLPVLAHQRYTDVDLAARPEAMAISVVITVLVIVAVVVGAKLARRSVRQDAP